VGNHAKILAPLNPSYLSNLLAGSANEGADQLVFGAHQEVFDQNIFQQCLSYLVKSLQFVIIILELLAIISQRI